MAFGSFNNGRGAAPMAEINIVPLVDIMLVLLVIFIVTAPLLSHAVKIDLPHAASTANVSKPDTINIAIDASGALFWNGAPLARAELLERMQRAGRQQAAPELHLRADRNTRYEVLANVMSEAGKAGLNRIGFVTDPGAPAPAASNPSQKT